MKNRIFLLLLSVALCVACEKDSGLEVSFTVDKSELLVGPDRSTEYVTVNSPDELWIAETSASWITISPANGYGLTECEFTFNTTQQAMMREATVRITNTSTNETKYIAVTQGGYAKEIKVDVSEVTLENYAAYGSRTFEVEITTNIDFEVTLEGETTSWLTVPSDFDVELVTGYTPQKFTLEMGWNVNSVPTSREATIKFVPLDSSEELETHHEVYVWQEAGDLIEPTPEGDSLALVAINRNLGGYDWPVERMMYWGGVELWEKTDEGVTDENLGRVRSALFYMINSNEALPFEISYLTAAESISISSNTNSQFKELSMNNFWGKLTNLKYLQIMAYGITDIDESLVELGGTLETLDVSCNNFNEVPEIITRENFPALKEFRITASQYAYYWDLSNIIEEYGTIGLEQDISSLEHFFEWDSLEVLALGVNYLHGTIPTMEDYDVYYTQADIDNSYSAEAGIDTLPQYMLGKRKVLPNVTELRLNLNRLTGDIPDWILYHPQLSLWDPGTLIFTQDGLTREGVVAGFDNEPKTYDYYYTIYTYLADQYNYFDQDDEVDETLEE